MSEPSDSLGTLGRVEAAETIVYVRATVHLAGGIYPGWEDWVDISKDPQWFGWAFESGALVVLQTEETNDDEDPTA